MLDTSCVVLYNRIPITARLLHPLQRLPYANRCSFAHDKTHILSFSEDLLTLGESVSFSNSRSKGGRVASRRRGREGCGRADEKRGKGELHCFAGRVCDYYYTIDNKIIMIPKKAIDLLCTAKLQLEIFLCASRGF